MSALPPAIMPLVNRNGFVDQDDVRPAHVFGHHPASPARRLRSSVGSWSALADQPESTSALRTAAFVDQRDGMKYRGQLR